MSKYWEAKIHMVLVALVLVGAVNWGFHATGHNLVEMLNLNLNNTFHTNYQYNHYIYMLVAVSAVILAFKKETWLPFLGRSTLPSDLVPLSKPSKTDTEIKVHVAPNTKVAYWASLPNTKSHPHVKEAYGKYENSGVVVSDARGVATLPVIKGTGYTLPSGFRVGRHVQYRSLPTDKSMMGEVHTKYY